MVTYSSLAHDYRAISRVGRRYCKRIPNDTSLSVGRCSMQTFYTAVRNIIRCVLWSIALIGVLWFLLPDYRLFFQSLLLGSFASLINGLLLYLKVWKITGNIGKTKGIGMVQRFAVTIIAVFVALRFPELFQIIGVIIGLLVFQVFSIIFVYYNLKNR